MTINLLTTFLLVTSLCVDLVTAILLSLGVLTPDMVRSTGKKLASYISAKPNNNILKAAHGKVFKSDDFFEWVDQCIIEVTVAYLTYQIAALLTFLIVLIGSILLSLSSLVGFIVTINKANINLMVLLFSVVGGLLSFLGFILCFCGFSDFLSNNFRWTNKPFEQIHEFLKVIAKGWIITYPIFWILTKVLSLFTMTLPLAWYRSLKIVDSHGLNWLFTLVGVILAIFSFTLQIVAAIFTLLSNHAA